MDAETVAQLVSLILAVLGIVWHQQHSTQTIRDELHETSREHREELKESNRQQREELKESNRQQREELKESNRQLREDHNLLREAVVKLSDVVVENGVRLARIEGRLGIPGSHVPDESSPDESGDTALC